MKAQEINQYFGLNTKDSRASLPIGFSPEGYNMDYSIRGVAKTRGGLLKFNSAALGYNAMRIHDYYKPSTKTHTFLGNGGTEVFKLSNVGVKTTVGSGLTSGEIFDFINFQDTCYMSNGVDDPKKYDGTNFYNWGLVAPTTAITYNADTAGSLTGVYSYVYT